MSYCVEIILKSYRAESNVLGTPSVAGIAWDRFSEKSGGSQSNPEGMHLHGLKRIITGISFINHSYNGRPISCNI